MTFETILSLIAFSFVSTVTPGPNNLMLMTSGTDFGFRKTIPHMLGVAIGGCDLFARCGAPQFAIYFCYFLDREYSVDQ